MAKIQQAGELIDVGGVEIPSALIATCAVVGFQKNGCVLINDRMQVLIPTVGPDGGKANVKYTIALYVTRDPMTETESLEVAKVADERKAAQDKKAADEQGKRERELRFALDLQAQGQQAGIAQLRSTLPVMAELQKLTSSLKVE